MASKIIEKKIMKLIHIFQQQWLLFAAVIDASNYSFGYNVL